MRQTINAVASGGANAIVIHKGLVEAGHRHDAYDMVVNHATTLAQQRTVLRCLKKCLSLWHAYRDNVARVCGLKKPSR